MYRHFFKRLIDIICSFFGILFLGIPMLVIALIIMIEDPGPAFFKQKRVGIHKKHFMLIKFRSMKMDTPHDVPTHLLENPDQYILKSGKFLSGLKTLEALDVLPYHTMGVKKYEALGIPYRLTGLEAATSEYASDKKTIILSAMKSENT